ncbi:hypothetical protein M0R88_11085 [Halorussus gelatinilyticus]|uniref:Uncharacterized protein n=1 Tax=Halorussus gelatinilyticus TaxID=2937524 RepID=A0A8U0IEF8_9EURY|nr:hypothetical protein [Halorussus gelatinilyticus]UPV99070.1 hypothetical protein M0R88_11085 [Halorussus gelatinilyticus]
MDNGTAFAAGLTATTGLAFVAAAVHSLRPNSPVRGWFGVEPANDAAVRSNAAVAVASGVGLVALAVAVGAGVSERVIGTASVLVGASACVTLGWSIRYRDRRELLTTPDASRKTARRPGASAMLCGFLVLPLAPAIWFGASAALVVGLAVGGALGGLVAVGLAYR